MFTSVEYIRLKLSSGFKNNFFCVLLFFQWTFYALNKGHESHLVVWIPSDFFTTIMHGNMRLIY